MKRSKAERAIRWVGLAAGAAGVAYGLGGYARVAAASARRTLARWVGRRGLGPHVDEGATTTDQEALRPEVPYGVQQVRVMAQELTTPPSSGGERR